MSTLNVQLENMLIAGKDTEKKLAKVLLESPDDIAALNAAQLGDIACVSGATVVRFARSLGYKGYPDLKLAFLSEIKSDKNDRLYGDLSKDDSTEDMIAKSGHMFSENILHSVKLLKPELIDRLAEKMIKAERVVLFGIGSSSIVANDIFHKLLRVNKNALFSPDLHSQLSYSNLLMPGDLALFVSARGETSEINTALKQAKSRGCLTIALTRSGHCEAAKIADEVLPYFYNEQHSQLGMITPQILQMVVFDILFFKFSALLGDSATAALAQGRAMLHGNK